MSARDSPVESAIALYLATGDHDIMFRGWPGGSLLEACRNGSATLVGALIAAVNARTAGVALPAVPVLPGPEFTRAKVAPMVAGLFPAAERPAVLAMLERSVVYLTPANIDAVLRGQGWPHTAWALANLYLVSVGAERLADDAPSIVGLSEETRCYVSPAYFRDSDPFADFVVHEAAHVFHNCKRETVGLRETRRREFLLDIDFGRRETFAYACEAYSRIAANESSAARRLDALARHADGPLPRDDGVDVDEYLDILDEAVRARNGWKRIRARCAPAGG